MTTTLKLLSNADSTSFAFNSPKWGSINVIIQNNLDGIQYYSLLICPAILAAASPVWQAMLNQPCQEKETNEIIFIVSDSCEAECFYGLIESIHSRVIPSYIVSDSVKLIRFLLIADQYQVEAALNSAICEIKLKMNNQYLGVDIPVDQRMSVQIMKQFGQVSNLPIFDELKTSALNYCFILISEKNDYIIQILLEFFSPIELFINDSRLLNLSVNKMICLLSDSRWTCQKEESFCAFIHKYYNNSRSKHQYISDKDLENLVRCVKWNQITTSYLLDLLQLNDQDSDADISPQLSRLIRQYSAQGLSIKMLNSWQKQKYIQHIQDNIEIEQKEEKLPPKWKWISEQLIPRVPITSSQLDKLRCTDLIIKVSKTLTNRCLFASETIVRHGMHLGVEIGSFFDSNEILWPEISVCRYDSFDTTKNDAEHTVLITELNEDPVTYTLRIWNYVEKKWTEIFSQKDTLKIEMNLSEEKVCKQQF